MRALADMMNTVAGRAARVILGLVLIYVGLAVVDGTGGTIVALVGIVPIVLGVSGRCLIEFVPGAR